MRVATHIFKQTISVCVIFNDQSFEQLGPELVTIL